MTQLRLTIIANEDANGERPPVVSIRLISSDMQNILGTKCLRWAEAKEEEDGADGSSMKESSSDSVEWLSRSPNLHLRNGQLIL